ncbi:hypothetical protein SFR_5104 [Streptomyces sp. FR-008]|nr:hypothetical protein SFR_5104 [Streptomyces sp. FR-008]
MPAAVVVPEAVRLRRTAQGHRDRRLSVEKAAERLAQP